MDRSLRVYQGLGLPLPQDPDVAPRDQIVPSGSFGGEVVYGQQAPFTGVPVPDSGNGGKMTLEATGDLDAPLEAPLEVYTVQAGLPAPSGTATAVWRYEGGDYHGWEPPATPSAWEALEWTDGSASYDVRSTGDAHSLGLPDGTLLVAYRDRYVLGFGTFHRVRLARRDRTTGAWSTQTIYSTQTAPVDIASGGGFHPCMWFGDSKRYVAGAAGVVFLAHWVEKNDQANVVVYSSLDGGVTWKRQSRKALRENVPVGSGSNDYIPGRLRAAWKPGQVMMVAALRGRTTTGTYSKELFLQLAAPDDGLDFRRVALWDRTATPIQGGKWQEVIVVEGKFVCLYVSRDTTVSSYRGVYRVAGNAWQDLRSCEEIAIDVDGLSEPWAVPDSTTGYEFTDGDMAAALLPDQSIWVYGRQAGGTGNSNGVVFRLRSLGDSFEPVGNAAPLGVGRWWGGDDADTSPTSFTAAHQGGRVVIVGNHRANPGDEDGSLHATYLGGWSSAPLPSYAGGAEVTERMSWTITWLPFDLPASTGTTWTATVAPAFTATLDTPGHLAIVTTGGRAFYSAAPATEAATGIVGLFDLRVNSGGSTATNGVGMRLACETGGTGYDVIVRMTTTQVQVYDAVAAANIGSAVTLPGAGYHTVLVALAAGKVSVWVCDSSVPTQARTWTTVVDAGTAASGAVAAGLVVWGAGLTAAGSADVDWRLVAFAEGTDVGELATELAAGVDAPDSLHGAPVPVRPWPLIEGASIMAQSGPTRAGDAWTIGADYQFPARYMHPQVKATPRVGWRSVDANTEQTVGMRASTSDGDAATSHGVLVCVLFGVEQRLAYLEGRVESSGLWVPLATLDACNADTRSTDGLAYIQTGDTLVPDRTATSTTQPWMHSADFIGGYARLDAGKVRKIYAQTSGQWADSTSGNVMTPVLHLQGIDGSESATGDAELWSPRVGVAVDVGDVRYQAYRLRFPVQDTASGYFAVGTWFLGHVQVFGVPYGWGRTIVYEAGAVVEEREDGTSMVYNAKPSRRTFGVAFDPIDTSGLHSGDADVAYGGIALPPTAIASPQATPGDLEGLLAHVGEGGAPIVYLPRIDLTDGPQILTSRHDVALVRVDRAPELRAELGYENDTEVLAAVLVLREEV